MKALSSCCRPNDEAIASALGALAHPARIAILRHLSCIDDCRCKDVVAQLDLAQSTVSQHLKVLVEAGLVEYASEKQRSRYSIDQAALQGLAGLINGLVTACCAQAEPRINAHERRA